MYCSKCGKKSTIQGARFCRSCGNPLEGMPRRKNRSSSPYDKPITYQDTWVYWNDSQYDKHDNDYDDHGDDNDYDDDDDYDSGFDHDDLD